jgi:uncharacterized protein (DUF2147 family)
MTPSSDKSLNVSEKIQCRIFEMAFPTLRQMNRAEFQCFNVSQGIPAVGLVRGLLEKARGEKEQERTERGGRGTAWGNATTSFIPDGKN